MQGVGERHGLFPALSFIIGVIDILDRRVVVTAVHEAWVEAEPGCNLGVLGGDLFDSRQPEQGELVRVGPYSK